MIKNKFLALAMAAAAAMTLATAVPAFADNTTTVSLTVAPKNTYTMTVPSATNLDSTGEATELAGGIQITGGDLAEGKKITVKASSAADWKMSAEGKTTTISYSLYSDEGTTSATTWEFSQAEANAANGATKAVYAKANATDVANAASGTYSDVITFTAKVESATPMVSFTFEDGSYQVKQGTTWSEFVSTHNINIGGKELWEETSWTQKNLGDVIEAGTYKLYEGQ